MTEPVIRPCRCGAIPRLTERQQYGINILQMLCACRLKGGTVMYTKPEDRDRTRQATIDGWNLSD